MNVVIVGGGIAGLTAAWTLADGGVRVMLLDARHRLGGRMGSEIWRNRVIDRGAQFFFSGYRVIPRLLANVGLADQLVAISPHSAVLREGRFRRFNMCRPMSMMISGLLSWPGSYRFLRALPPLSHAVGSLSVDDLACWAGLEASFGDAEAWTHEVFGPEVASRFIAPLLRGLCFQELKRTSPTLPACLLALALRRSNLLALRGGVGALIQAMSQRVTCRSDCPVQAVRPARNGVETLLASGAAIWSDYVILATTAGAAANIWSPDSEAAGRLLRTPYSTTIQITLACRGGHRMIPALRGVYGVLLPASESPLIAVLSFEGNRIRDRGAEGEVITLMLDDAPARELAQASDDDVLDRVVAELENHLPGLAGNPLSALVMRWPEAVPFATPGHAQAIARWRKTLDPSSRVLLAGDYLNFPWSDGAAASGIWAARWILQTALKVA
jgi:oxygen-dependent protoporphyrinogen oxidase